VAWVISGDDFYMNEHSTSTEESSPKVVEFKQRFADTIIEYHQKGGGLMIYGDDDPLFVHANLVLPSLVGCQLIGNTLAGKILHYGEGNRSGFFDENHLVFAGINHLYEGTTICYPDRESKLVTIATSSDRNPCILMCEEGKSNYENGGRIIVDSGWTKLYESNWASAGQARYVVNATVWLLNLEGKFGMSVDDFK